MTFHAVVDALYRAGGPLTTRDIEKAVPTGRSVSSLTSDVVNQWDTFGPIRRIKEGTYDLTTRARERMKREQKLDHPRHTFTLVSTISPSRHSELVAALAAFLEQLPEAVQEECSFAELLQAFGTEDAAHEERVAGLRPHDLMPALDIALAQHAQKGLERSVERLPKGHRNDLRRLPSPDVTAAMIEGALWSPGRRIEVLCAHLHGTPTAPSIDALTDFTLPEGIRVHLGQPGMDVTRQTVVALHSECGDGEFAAIYPLGHVTAGAREAAARLQVTIHDAEAATSVFRGEWYLTDCETLPETTAHS